MKIDLKELLNKLDELQFKMKIYDKSEIDFEQFKLLALQLKPNDFVLDYHFDDLLVFNDQASKILTNSDLYHHGLIAMQDKVSHKIYVIERRVKFKKIFRFLISAKSSILCAILFR